MMKTQFSTFQTNKHLQRARLKGELRPMLSLAIHSFLSKKQEILVHNDTEEHGFSAAIDMLAPWNGFQVIQPSNLLPTNQFQRLQLGQGLVAEQAAFAAENYTVLKRISNVKEAREDEGQQDNHPPFVEEDASWYRALEARVDDNLNRWEDNARKRRQLRLKNVKQGGQRLMDGIQAPAARLNSRIVPEEDSVASQEDITPKEPKISEQSKDKTTEILPSGDHGSGNNETEPEDLIILTKEGGSLILLSDVHPAHRLLALPFVTVDGKTKPPYRLRLARGGLVITLSIIMLGAVPPTYRSLKFILEYPKTAQIVFISLVASMGYNLWSWRSNLKTRQRELIAAAIQSRLIARDEAALCFLTVGAAETLTDVLMESYVSLLLNSDEEKEPTTLDPLVVEIGRSLGLFRRPKRQPSQPLEKSGVVVAEEWEVARKALVHSLAVRM